MLFYVVSKEMEDPLDLREAVDFEPQEGKDRGTHMNIKLQDGEIKLRWGTVEGGGRD